MIHRSIELLQSTLLPPEEGGATAYPSSIASSIVSAFKNDRRLFRTDAGHLGSSTAQVKSGDLICKLQGYSQLVVLRAIAPAVVWRGVMSYPTKYKLVGCACLSSSLFHDKSPRVRPPEERVFDLC